MPESKGIPPWVWLGCGCLGALGALFILVVGLGVWGVHKARQLAEDIRNPDERAEKAVEVLGANEIPQGYYTVVALSVPFLFDLAILSDLAPDETGHPPELGERGFIYLSYIRIGQQDRELRDFFEGKTDDVTALERQNVDVDLDERVASGRITRPEDELLWVSHRGRIDASDSGRAHDGLVTLFLVECSSDSKTRLGIWFGPDPSSEKAPAELDLTGTVSDPKALEQFMEPIHPCR